MKKTFISAILLLLAASAALPQGARAYLKIGDKAPAFALPNGDGKLISLTETLTHGPLVLIFYRGYW
ncbi:MAG: hypothetical protein DMF61_07765 [Blastocatellia bacterium AA13]|nr:MAG: hypothetical protein DMF61_07765 [Blastocatellia bacterium AA13]